MAVTKGDVHLTAYLGDMMNFLFQQDADPRTDYWFLMSSPFPTIVICFSYVLIMTWAGPWFMKGRKPMSVKWAMMLYNAFQVVFNLWISVMIISGFYLNNYSFLCQPIDKSTSPNSMLVVRAAWWFYFSKYIDYFDTVFMILRKRYEQLTILHIGHHGVIAFPAWYCIKFLPGGHLTLLGLQNSSIHVIMYFYYFMAGMGPRFQKYLWWKKYLTIIQIAQFVFLLVHQSQLFFVDCDFPAYPRYWGLFFGPLLIIFFFNFYMESYINRAANMRTLAQHIASAIPCHNMQGLNEYDKFQDDGSIGDLKKAAQLAMLQQVGNRPFPGTKRAGGEQ